LYLKFESIGAALQYAYPDVEWELDKFSSRGKKSGQRWLKVMIERILPDVKVVEEYQHPDLIWRMLLIDCSPLSDALAKLHRRVELDIWIPQHRIGIEFQGMQQNRRFLFTVR
jgi:hypothetical protein